MFQGKRGGFLQSPEDVLDDKVDSQIWELSTPTRPGLCVFTVGFVDDFPEALLNRASALQC